MRLVKLDAIDSTNDYLKGLCKTTDVENFTIVTAEHQFNGKGQMGSKWISEHSKNLIMSILIKDLLSDLKDAFHLNVIVTMTIIDALKEYQIPGLSIKWPNDIMSGNKKIGGILIENIIKAEGAIISIVGLGLNVNQENFSELPKASSLYVICKKSFDKEEMGMAIAESIRSKVDSQLFKSEDLLTAYKPYYLNAIFRPLLKIQNNGIFMGIIQDVDDYGRLQIRLENNSIASFNIKEVQMLY